MKSIVIAFAIFASFASGKILECNYSVVTWPLVGSIYSCRARIIDNGNTNSIDEIRGNHLAGLTNANVEGFFLTEQNLGGVPRNLATFFQNLRAVDFSNAQISALATVDLSPIVKLAFFRVFNNRLTSIEGNLFASNLQLQYIDFGGNLLQSVGENLLGNLNSLTGADFSRNPCINTQAFTPPAIANLNQELPIRCPPSSPTTTLVPTTTVPTGPTVPTAPTVPTTTTTAVPTTTTTAVPTAPTAPTTTTKAPICSVPCSEIEELKATIVQQARAIADLERRLGESGAR